jgi:hypothetical protein
LKITFGSGILLGKQRLSWFLFRFPTKIQKMLKKAAFRGGLFSSRSGKSLGTEKRG